MIDLHAHTTASDGEHSADALFDIAKKAGVTMLAVTDHDTVDGLGAAQAASDRTGVTLIPGIEVSIRFNNREVHILGHFIDPTEPKLAAFSKHLRGERYQRMLEMVAAMQKLGYPVTMEEVLSLAGDAHLARPHLARALVEHGWCSSTKDAFDRFLADGKPAAVGRFEVTIDEAVSLIRNAGGTATLAHPGVSKVNELELKQMTDAGLSGIEIDHSDHPPSQREKYREWAGKLGLVGTAGTDFHGLQVAPNRIFGKVSMTAVDLEALKARRQAGATR